jgi:hypothetical protein
MKIDHAVAGAIIAGLTAGTLRNPRSITDSNRLHSERAPHGSIEAQNRIEAAELKRQRKACL